MALRANNDGNTVLRRFALLPPVACIDVDNGWNVTRPVALWFTLCHLY